MADKQQVEILIIGSGEAGKYLAWTMAKAGRRTVVVERGLIGGSCPNIACMPSKNIVHSAKVEELAAGEPSSESRPEPPRSTWRACKLASGRWLTASLTFIVTDIRRAALS